MYGLSGCSIVATAFLGTCVVFGCFTLASLYAPDRKYLYLGGECFRVVDEGGIVEVCRRSLLAPQYHVLDEHVRAALRLASHSPGARSLLDWKKSDCGCS